MLISDRTGRVLLVVRYHRSEQICDRYEKILIISPHFCPENFKCNDVAFELARRG